MKVALTIFTAPENESICKKVEIGTDGGLEVVGGGKFFQGRFETKVCDWKDFGNVLAGLSLNQGLCLGTCMVKDKHGKFMTEGTCGVSPGQVRRTKKNFGWNAKAHGADANIVLLDIDDIPSEIAVLGHEGLVPLIERVVEDVKELDKVSSGFFAWPSAGAFIYKGSGRESESGEGTEEELVRGFTGAHIYFPLPAEEGRDPDLFRNYLRWSLICAGKFSIAENAKCMLRAVTAVDSFAIGSERIDYIAGSDCGEGKGSSFDLVQKRGDVVWVESEGRDDFVLGETDEWSRARGDVLVEKAKIVYKLDPGYIARSEAYAEQESKKIGVSKREYLDNMKSLERGVVKGSMPILVFRGSGKWEPVPAWQMLFDPDKYDGALVGDPRDDGRKSGGPGTAQEGKCKFFANSGGQFAGRPKLHGFVGGDCVFDIQMDLPSVREIVREFSSLKEAEEGLGVDWWRVIGESNLLSAAERETIMQELSSKWFGGGGSGRKDMVAKIKSAVVSVDKKRSGDSLAEKVEAYNAIYSCVRVGDDVRIFWEEFEEEHFGSIVTVEMSKLGFFDWMKTDTVWDLDSKGKPVATEVSKAWWSNKNRKQYKGLIFAPWTKEKEVHGKLNMYKGWGVDALAVGRRGCEGRGCGGEGCLNWFLKSDGGMKAVDAEHDSGALAGEGLWKEWGCGYDGDGGCTWWFRHLYENICCRKIEEFIWGLDWFADIFQNPETKPGTVFAMRGGQGAGKGILIKPIEAAVRKHFYQCRSPRELTGQFNAHLENLLLVFSDEAFWAGNPEAGSIWKALVTEQTLGIEKKFRDMVVSKSYLRACLATNDAWAVMVEKDDRRHFCLDVSERYQNRDIYGNDQGLGAYWDAIVGVDSGALLSELLSRKITSNVRVPPVTEGLKAQKAQSMGPAAKLVSILLERYPQVFDGFGVANATLFYIAQKEGVGGKYLKQKPLSHELGELLVKNGCATKAVNLMSGGSFWGPIEGEPTVIKGKGIRIDREKTEELMINLYGEE